MQDAPLYPVADFSAWDPEPLATPVRHRLGARLTAAGGWLVVAAVVFAPWALGSIPPGARLGLQVLMGSAILCWLLGRLLTSDRIGVPGVVLACAAWLLAQGWWMVINAHSIYSSSKGLFLQTDPLWTAGPGTVDPTVSWHAMLQATVVLGVLGLVADLGRWPRWRARLWAITALVGVSIAAFGLAQRAGLTDAIARQMPPGEGFTFATYNYHGNAGAFLNLVLPMVCGVALLAWRLPRNGAAKMIAGGMLLTCLAAAFVNVSKAAMALTVLLMVTLGGWTLFQSDCPTGSDKRVRQWGAAAVVLTVLASLVTAVGGSAAWQRWAALPQQLDGSNGRMLMGQAAAPMAADAGMWGYGPGTFKVLLPHSEHVPPALYRNWIVQEHVPGERVSIWSHAHQDYLQAVVEWGWMGAVVWGVLLLGGLATLARAYTRADVGTFADRLLMVCIGAALGSICLHALVDFPLQIPSLELYTAVYLGLAWSSRDWEQNAGDQKPEATAYPPA